MTDSGAERRHWFGTWGASSQPIAPGFVDPPSVEEQTVRQIVRISLGGSQLRLKLSNAETDRLMAWAGVDQVAADITDGELAKRLSRDGPAPLRDRFALALAKAFGEEDETSAETLRGRIRRNTVFDIIE